MLIYFYETGSHVAQVGLELFCVAKDDPEVLIPLPQLPQVLGLWTCVTIPSLCSAGMETQGLMFTRVCSGAHLGEHTFVWRPEVNV